VSEATLAADEAEYLDPGYDQATPGGDNVLNDFCRADSAGWRRWVLAAGGRAGHDPALGISWADSGSPSVFANPCHWTRPIDADQVGPVIENLGAEYGAQPGGSFLVYSAFPTPDLREHGMAPVGHPPMMVRPPGARPARAAASSLRVERVATPDQLLDFERVLVEGFPVDELLPWRPASFVSSTIVDDEAWRLWVGYDGDRAVATAAAVVTDEVTVVNLVAVHPDARRRGFGEEVTWAATWAEPANPAALIASDDGRPVYERMGYLTVLRFTLWIGSRPSSR
jgi:GNAT superfamily N-acetyltransferase